MYKIKENNRGHFIIVFEDTFLWWKRYYYLCAKRIKMPGNPSPEECKTAYFSSSTSDFKIQERLVFPTMEQANQGFNLWKQSHDLAQLENLTNIQEHTLKDNGQELELS